MDQIIDQTEKRELGTLKRRNNNEQVTCVGVKTIDRQRYDCHKKAKGQTKDKIV